MSIGRTCPRHKELALLFPKSRDLQRATCDYFVAVVRLCKDIVLFSKQSLLSQLANTIAKPFEAKFSSYQSELQKLAAHVKDEVSLASKQIQVFEAQAQALERKAASSSRQLTAVFREQVNQDLAEARLWRRNLVNTRLLDTCSTFDHRRAWKQSRKLGTSTWIFNTEEYTTWQSKSESSFLSLTGKLGSGKTVLSACVVESLTLVEGSMAAYFYCRFDDSESLEARTIIGSLTRQILEYNQSTLKIDELRENPKLDLDDLANFLKLHWPQNHRNVFVVVDGLDECTPKESRIAVQWLKKFYLTRNRGALLKIFISSRREVLRQNGDTQAVQLSISMPKTNDEISDYIRLKLEESLLSGALVMQDPELILKISDALGQGAQGMFLWVAFQIQTICAQPSDHEILEALHNLPKDLPETFDRIIEKLFQHVIVPETVYRRMFDIISATFRPLTVAELREALCVEPGNIEWDPSRCVNDLQKVIDSCGGLLVVDEEHLTVHFAHHSISTYLASDAVTMTLDSPKRRLMVDMEAAKVLIALICLTYLSFSAFEQQVAKVDKSMSVVTTSPTKILEAGMPGSSLMTNLALALLRRTTRANNCMELNFDGLLKHRQHSTHNANLGVFKAYVDSHWSRHCFTALRLDSDAICHLKAYNSATSLFLRSICRTKEFDLLTLSAPWLDKDLHAVSVLLNIAYNPKYIIPWTTNTILGRVSSETLREYDVEIESLIPLKRAFESQPAPTRVVANPRPWSLISFAAALGQLPVLKSLTRDAPSYILNDTTIWESVSRDYVRAFREATCRGDRDVIFELVKGAMIIFRNSYVRATDEWNNDMMYYGLTIGDQEICIWLAYSSLHFDLREGSYRDGPLGAIPLPERIKMLRALRASSGLAWMEDYVQNVHINISADLRSKPEPLDGISRRIDIHRTIASRTDPRHRSRLSGPFNPLTFNPLGFQGSLVTGYDEQAYGLESEASKLLWRKILMQLLT